MDPYRCRWPTIRADLHRRAGLHPRAEGAAAEGRGARGRAAAGSEASNARHLGWVADSTIELSNFEGFVLGCIEAKFCK